MSALKPDSKFNQLKQLFGHVVATYEIACSSPHFTTCTEKFVRISNVHKNIVTEGDAALQALQNDWQVIDGRVHCPSCARTANLLRKTA